MCRACAVCALLIQGGQARTHTAKHNTSRSRPHRIETVSCPHPPRTKCSIRRPTAHPSPPGPREGSLGTCPARKGVIQLKLELNLQLKLKFDFQLRGCSYGWLYSSSSSPSLVQVEFSVKVANIIAVLAALTGGALGQQKEQGLNIAQKHRHLRALALGTTSVWRTRYET